ncbi:MAG TPA: hypothetical protein VKY59_08360 [Spirillospora sp.]|nr:hypothetical protein [Spirillospora sp.]
MIGYCKHCHQTHAAWTRLNNGVICGLCGTRERDLRVTPVNAQTENRRASLVPARVGRPSF